ncbi:MAG: HAMP domain-containing histidine kinase [Thermoproteota archaeon]|nr:HAMP domain-containing histidine kinase [Thermoproteota archaeon]
MTDKIYKNAVAQKQSDTDNGLNYFSGQQLAPVAFGLINSSDALVTQLGQQVKDNQDNLIILQIIFGVLIILLILFILFLVRHLLKPISSLTKATSEIKKGNLNVSVDYNGRDELSALIESFNSMVATIKNDTERQTELYQQLKKSEELQKDFIRIAAHELRNPIQPILVISEMLNSTVNSKKLVNSSQIRVDKQEINDYIDAIIRNTRKLVSLTNSILDITRIETNSLTLRKETVDLRLFLLEQVMEYENQYISKIENMDLHTTTSRDRCKTRMDYSQLNNSRIHCSLLVDLDKSMISQVVYNLLDNALSLQMRAT